MTGEEAVQQVEALLAAKGKHLSYLKRAIFLGAWRGLSYEAMIHTWQREYDYSYIKAQGAELCKLLSVTLGIKVTKAYFQQVVAEGLHRSCSSIASPTMASSTPHPPD